MSAAWRVKAQAQREVGMQAQGPGNNPSPPTRDPSSRGGTDSSGQSAGLLGPGSGQGQRILPEGSSTRGQEGPPTSTRPEECHRTGRNQPWPGQGSGAKMARKQATPARPLLPRLLKLNTGSSAWPLRPAPAASHQDSVCLSSGNICPQKIILFLWK